MNFPSFVIEDRQPARARRVSQYTTADLDLMFRRDDLIFGR
jgi:hypothetical protein